MSFQLVYLSQQDPQWKSDILGFGDSTDTIGYEGCALTSLAMLMSGFGYSETPQTLNDKLKAANGFISAMIRWDVISKVHSQFSLQSNVTCETTDAPLAQIDAALANGQPVIVRVDSSPAPGLQWHYVLLYAKNGNDYLMLDPYPYNPGTSKPDSLMKRYSQGNPLQRAIQQVLIYSVPSAGGPIATPGGSTQPAPAPAPAPAPSPAPSGTPAPSGSGIYVQPTADVTAFLNLRSSTDTSSMANVIAQIYPGTKMLLLDAGAENNIGAQGQFLRVRDPQGNVGYVAAWYVERASSATTSPAPSSTPAPTPSSNFLTVVVSSKVGTDGLKVFSDSAPRSDIFATEKAGTHLTVVESPTIAKGRIGVEGQWIRVRASNGKVGFVRANLVELVS